MAPPADDGDVIGGAQIGVVQHSVAGHTGGLDESPVLKADAVGQVEGILLLHTDIFRHGAVTVDTHDAQAVCGAERLGGHPFPHLEVPDLAAHRHNGAGELVAGNKGVNLHGDNPLIGMDVGAAHAAAGDLDLDLVALGFGLGHLAAHQTPHILLYDCSHTSVPVPVGQSLAWAALYSSMFWIFHSAAGANARSGS